jgi:hypothetical protein
MGGGNSASCRRRVRNELDAVGGADGTYRADAESAVLSRRRSWSDHMVSSPCVGVCETENGVCVACDRTLDDIAMWAAMSEAERIERMAELDGPTDADE